MANYISFKPNDVFNTKLYTGNGSTTHGITGVGFQPDFTWMKKRNAAESHVLIDAVRGVTKYIEVDTADAEATDAQSLKSFDADGFTLGNAGRVNNNTNPFVSYSWKLGTTSVPSGGSITPTAVNYSAAQGMGIYKWSGTAGNGTIAHGLGQAPTYFWVKELSGGATTNWYTGGNLLSDGNYNMYLNTNNAQGSAGSALWQSNFPSSTLMYLGTDGDVNGSGKTYVMYAFAPVNGFSSFGNYKGNGNANGTFIHCGFKPAFVIIKIINDTKNWMMYDNKRWYSNTNTTDFQNTCFSFNMNTGDAGTASASDIDLNSQGFKIRTSGGLVNEDGANYIYFAFADQPTAFNNGDAATAR